MRKLAGIAVVAAVMMSMAACTADLDGDDSAINNPVPDDGCTYITVATSSEKINLMDELSAMFKESPEMAALDNCVTVAPVNVASGTAAEALISNAEWGLSDEQLPTLWSPAASIWVERVAAVKGEGIVADSASFTKTPVVFAMPETMAEELGWPDADISLTDIENLISDPEGWGTVGKDIWGSFKIAKTNPNTSTTGLNTILMQSYEAVGKTEGLTVEDIAASADFSQAFELGAIHYGNTTGGVLTRLYNDSQSGAQGSSYVSAIAVEETSLINYNLGNPNSHTVQPGEVLTPPREQLVAIYPSNGSLWSDNPIVTLKANWVTPEEQAAGDAFIEFLHTTVAQSVLPEYGFRPLDDNIPLGKLFTKEHGVIADQPAVSLEAPSASVVSAAIDQWTEIRKPSAVLQMVDISGSMDDSAGDTTKLELAISSIQNNLEHFRTTDEVGIWAFTTSSEGSDTDISVVRDFSAIGSDMEGLIDDVADVRYAGHYGTPLYDSILEGYKYMSDIAEPGRINAIVILSDGDDTDSSMSLSSLLVELSTSSESQSDAPVRVFTIAYGEGANTEALTAIAEATGGQMFDASDPTSIDKVFASVINNF